MSWRFGGSRDHVLDVPMTYGRFVDFYMLYMCRQHDQYIIIPRTMLYVDVSQRLYILYIE